ncbi:MAG: ABC transporter permease [Oscillospiraceae bacterium]|jgi:NitT/TauT family transport system permease protein|nr:ABC transporter permease [Oscillospiraceae bacterium]
MKRFLITANKKLKGFYVLIAVLVLWQTAPRAGWVNPIYVPSITTIITQSELTPAMALKHIIVSLRRMVVGFSICTVIALPLAFILGGAIPALANVLRLLLQFLSQIPPYILYPVLALFAGIGEKSVVMIVFWAGLWPLLFTTIQGVQDINPRLISAARAMNANSALIFFKVIVPATFPNIMRGIRLGLNNSFLILIGAENIGGKEGLGWLIGNANKLGKINRVYFGAFLVVILGIALNFGIQKLENRVTGWKRLPSEAAV